MPETNLLAEVRESLNPSAPENEAEALADFGETRRSFIRRLVVSDFSTLIVEQPAGQIVFVAALIVDRPLLTTQTNV